MNNLDNFRKQELSCGTNVYPVLKYLEKTIGYKKMLKSVEKLGLPVNYLLIKTNWVSYEYYLILLDELIKATDDELAPYKIYTDIDYKNLIENIFDDIFTVDFFLISKNSVQFLLSLLIQKKLNKIGSSEMLYSKNNSLYIQIKVKKKYKINKPFCLTVKGFILALINYLNKKDQNINDLKSIEQSQSSCIFKIKLDEKKNIINKLLYMVFPILSVILTFILFINKIDFRNILLCFLLFLISNLILILISKSIQFKNNLKKNTEKDNEIIKTFKKIESNFHDKNLEKQRLSETNEILILKSKINELINNDMHFSTVLFDLTKIILKELNIHHALYFQKDLNITNFNLSFEQINKNSKVNKIYDISAFKRKYNGLDFLNIKEIKYSIDARSFFNKLNISISSDSLKNLNEIYIFILPIDLSTVYQGFILFISAQEINISTKNTEELFKEIYKLIEIGFNKIISRNNIENILSSIPTNVLIFNINNFKIRYINNLFISSFPGIAKKYTKSNIIGKNIFDIIDFDQSNKEKLITELKNYSSNKIIKKSEIKIERKLYEYNLFFLSQTHEENSEKLAGIIFNDITEANYFQQQLLLNEKLIALGKTASGIAHEINNPLYGILSHAEEISNDDEVDKEHKKNAENIIDYVMSISNIVKDLSNYSKTLRIEEIADIDLNEVIKTSLEIVHYSSKQYSYKIVKNLNKIPSIKARKGEIQQVFINLINNAIHALDKDGIIEISSEYNNKKIIISIKDNGHGIKKEDQDYIFDLYFTTKDKDKGTGQGLHIVKKIIDSYKGEISFESKEKKGTVFYIKFKIE